MLSGRTSSYITVRRTFVQVASCTRRRLVREAPVSSICYSLE